MYFNYLIIQTITKSEVISDSPPNSDAYIAKNYGVRMI